jgi:hypothetical protein
MPSRKKKHQRELKRKQKKQEREERFRASQPFADSKVVFEPPGVEKMSEVILEFLDPYMEDVNTPERMDRLLSIGVLAWNAALLPASQRDELLQKLQKSLETRPPEVQEELRHFFTELIQRKESSFAHNKRFIIDYQLTMTPSGPHVSVISSFDQNL